MLLAEVTLNLLAPPVFLDWAFLSEESAHRGSPQSASALSNAAGPVSRPGGGRGRCDPSQASGGFPCSPAASALLHSIRWL